MMTESYQITAVGDGHVGKTCMLLSYTTNACPSGYEPTIFENYHGKIEVDGKTYTVGLWDTAGQEEYSRLRPLSYKLTDCFLICFSVESKDSYQNVITKWAPEVKHFKPNAPIILIGTKIDLRENHDCLNEDNGIKLQKIVKAQKYLECSAVTKLGINNIFQEAVRTVLITKKRKRKKCCIL